MARSFSGAGQLENISAIISAEPFTVAGWFKADNITSTGCLINIGTDGSGNQGWKLVAAGGDTGDPLLFVGRTGSDSASETTTGFSAGVWHFAAGTAASATDRKVYIDAGSEGTDVTSKVISAPDSVSLGTQTNGANDFSGDMAEWAVWDVVLTAAELTMLNLGVSPLLVRPGNLVAYWPLIGRFSPEIDRVGGFDLTVTGATAANHPAMRYANTNSVLPLLPSVPGGGGGAASSIRAINISLGISL